MFYAVAQPTSRIISYTPSSERSCDSNNVCQVTVYSYEKYWLNSEGNWETIDTDFYDCSERETQRFCTKNYYFTIIADAEGTVRASYDGEEFSARMSTFLNRSLSFEPLVEGNRITYPNAAGSNVDLRYTYFPHKLKEEIIIKEPLSDLPAELLDITFTRAGDASFSIERSYICDAAGYCEYIDSTITEETITVHVPVRFLNDSSTEYPVVIDPTLTLNYSHIAWNGYIQYAEDDLSDPPETGYTRFNNPDELKLSSPLTWEPAWKLKRHRSAIEWNLSSIPSGSVIYNATLLLTSKFPGHFGSEFYEINIHAMDRLNTDYADEIGACPDGNCLFYNDMGNGTLYNMTRRNNSNTYRQDTFILNAVGRSAIESALSSNRIFGVGLRTDANDTVYIAPRDHVQNASQRPQLIIVYGSNMTDSLNAIEQGINNSLPSNPIEENKQIYVVNEHGQHFLGMFDHVTSRNNQTWAFHYVLPGGSFLGIPSLFKVLNIWENQSLSYSQIVSQVENFINATRY